MGNWFAGLGQAASGMNAARYGISVVGQNIANANSDGYTRQVATQESVGGQNVAGLYTRPANDGIGGVKITGTVRVDDLLLDARVRNEHGKNQYASTSADSLSALEKLFPAASDDSLATQLTAFWGDWSAVANSPANTAARQVLLEDARTVVGTLHNLSSSLDDLTASMTSYLNQDIASANTAASQLAALNGQIGVASATGVDVNALMDQRDVLIDKLSQLTGAVSTVQPNGMADVKIGSVSLVASSVATPMSVDATGQVQVGTSSVSLTAGSAAARISALQVTMPTYRTRLDGVANALRDGVNAAQGAGYDLAGNPGLDMFGGSGAGGITVALTDGTQVAASATPGGNYDGSNALQAARIATSSSGPDSAYSALVGDLGAASAAAQHAAGTQQSLVDNIEAMHASVSGVSYDEEMAKMLTYQRAFDASSRALTTMDSMLDTLINHTGRAGLA